MYLIAYAATSLVSWKWRSHSGPPPLTEDNGGGAGHAGGTVDDNISIFFLKCFVHQRSDGLEVVTDREGIVVGKLKRREYLSRERED